MDDRGLSEVLGVLLTLLLVLFLVGILAGPALNSVDVEETQTFVTVEVTPGTGGELIINNHGGDARELATTTVLLRWESGEERVQLRDPTARIVNNDSNTYFNAGEKWEWNHNQNDIDPNEEVSVFIITENGRLAASWEGRAESGS